MSILNGGNREHSTTDMGQPNSGHNPHLTQSGIRSLSHSRTQAYTHRHVRLQIVRSPLPNHPRAHMSPLILPSPSPVSLSTRSVSEISATIRVLSAIIVILVLPVIFRNNSLPSTYCPLPSTHYMFSSVCYPLSSTNYLLPSARHPLTELEVPAAGVLLAQEALHAAGEEVEQVLAGAVPVNLVHLEALPEKGRDAR